MKRYTTYLVVLFTIVSAISFGQPRVYQLGSNEEVHTQLMNNYSTNLLMEFNGDVTLGFKYWKNFLVNISIYADEINFDLDGKKMWLHVFWNNDGSIDHIAYYLKPNSQFIPEEEMEAFFKSFIRQWKMKKEFSELVNFYGEAEFPLFLSKPTSKN